MAIDPDPIAPKHPHELRAHGNTRTDPWYWMQEKSPEVLRWIFKENAHALRTMNLLGSEAEQILTEARGLHSDSYDTMPVEFHGWEYFTRRRANLQYPIHMRRNIRTGVERVLLDENREANGHTVFQLADVDVSFGGNHIAFAYNTDGTDNFTIEIRSLRSGKTVDVIENSSSQFCWSGDDKGIYFVRNDPVTLRPHEVWKHQIGTPPERNRLIYFDRDPKYHVAIGFTPGYTHMMIGSLSFTTTELWIAPNNGRHDFKLVAPREEGVEYWIDARFSKDHKTVRYYMLTNKDGAVNNKVLSSSRLSTPIDEWQVVIPETNDHTILWFDANRHDALVITEADAEIRLHDFDYETGRMTEFFRSARGEILFSDPTFKGHEFYKALEHYYGPRRVRFSHESMIKPPRIYEHDQASGSTKVIWSQTAKRGFRSGDYDSMQVMATANDGDEIPIDLTFRKGTKLDGSAPGYISGYGSYGYSLYGDFRARYLSLLDRGFVVAFAHIRGGGEMGANWAKAAERRTKLITVSDFISCAEHLVANGFVHRNGLVSFGRSAGGIPSGGSLVERPDLFAGAHIQVPVVDPVTSQSDPMRPLAATHFPVTGDSRIAADYWAMMTYSPYDRVRPAEYPMVLLQGALNDTRVGYYEALKFAQKLRDNNTGENPILCQVHLQAGHTGSYARDTYAREKAFETAFVVTAARRGIERAGLELPLNGLGDFHTNGNGNGNRRGHRPVEPIGLNGHDAINRELA